MKKALAVMLGLVMMAPAAMAAEKIGYDAARHAHREEMKAIKKAQRENRQNPAAQPSSNAKGFWAREAERSGLGGNGNRFNEIGKALNPVDFFKKQQEAYEARKVGSVK